MPHHAAADGEIRVHIRQKAFDHSFDERRYAAIETLGYDDQFAALCKHESGLIQFIVMYACTGRLCPAAEASDAGPDIHVVADHDILFVFSAGKDPGIGYDHFHNFYILHSISLFAKKNDTI